MKLVKCVRAVAPRSSARNYTDWPYLKEEHIMIAQMCRNFAETELKPIAGKLDKERQFPTEQIRKLGELGMMGVQVSTDFGGSGMDAVTYSIAMEEVSRGCASSGVIMSAHNLYCSAIEKFGTLEQKNEFLTPWYSSKLQSS